MPPAPSPSEPVMTVSPLRVEKSEAPLPLALLPPLAPPVPVVLPVRLLVVLPVRLLVVLLTVLVSLPVVPPTTGVLPVRPLTVSPMQPQPVPLVVGLGARG